MGPLFVILIWGILALIGLLAFVSLLVLFILACWKKKRWLKWLSGVPLALLALLCLTVIGTLTFGLIQSMRPASVFKQAFQTSPKGVTNLQSKYWFFGDSGHMYLRFNCSTQTLARILPQGLLETDEVTLKEKLGKGWLQDPPDWWQLPATNTVGAYYLRESGQGGGRWFSTSEMEVLVYDSQTHTAFYFYSGLD